MGRRSSAPLFVVPDSLADTGRPRVRRGAGHTRARGYLVNYLRWLRVSDLLVIVVALGITTVTRFGFAQADLAATGIGYTELGLILTIAWVLMLNRHSAYDGRFTRSTGRSSRPLSCSSPPWRSAPTR